MKKISKELYKSYFYIIFLFVVSFAGILFFFISYINRNAGSDVKTLDSFLTYETSEYDKKLAKGKSLEELFHDALEECPEVLGTNVYFLHDGKKYSKKEDNGVLKSLDLDVLYDRIKTEGYFKYQYMVKDIKVNGQSPIELVIVKDMKHERKMIINVLIISFGIGMLALYGSIRISRGFYEEFANSLKKLQHITNNINLDTVGDKIDSENTFIEFDMIMNSYRKMLTRLKEQTDVQIDFVNNASHELKTPIFVIGGYINMVKRWGIENRDITNEAIEAIGDEVKTMSNLVNKLLFLAKGEVKEIDNGDVDIQKLLDEIKGELHHLYPAQKIEIKEAKFHIVSDQFLLRQLLINLLENAVKYGKGNEITVSSRLEKNLIIEIEDRGEGISEENLKHIYDKFFRVDKGRSREMGSHGLGLSIVKKISEALNIDINILSTLGKGTKVILTIPIEK